MKVKPITKNKLIKIKNEKDLKKRESDNRNNHKHDNYSLLKIYKKIQGKEKLQIFYDISNLFKIFQMPYIYHQVKVLV